jgi:hypothetical protein
MYPWVAEIGQQEWMDECGLPVHPHALQFILLSWRTTKFLFIITPIDLMLNIGQTRHPEGRQMDSKT